MESTNDGNTIGTSAHRGLYKNDAGDGQATGGGSSNIGAVSGG